MIPVSVNLLSRDRLSDELGRLNRLVLAIFDGVPQINGSGFVIGKTRGIVKPEDVQEWMPVIVKL